MADDDQTDRDQREPDADSDAEDLLADAVNSDDDGDAGNGDRDNGSDRSDRDSRNGDRDKGGDRSGSSDKGGKADKGDEPDGGWKGHARTWEKRARESKTARESAERERDEANDTLSKVRKAFGLDQDDEGDDDPKRVAEQAEQLAEQRAAELRTVKIEREAERAGRRKGADVDALLDSRGFAKALDKLDPESDDFGDELASLIDKSLEDNPRLKAAQSSTPPPSSEDMTGGGESGRNSDEPDDIDDIRKRRRERREA